VADANQETLRRDPPLGTYSAKVDEKGRLKLPSAFKEYLASFGDKRVFVTSLDDRTVRIYPISVWKANEKFFEEFTDDPEAAEDLAFVANMNGAGCEMDDQGRVLVPQELRRKLNLEDQAVWLGHHKGRIDVFGKDVYEERSRRAFQGLAGKLRELQKKGFN
jgi:MraZ protein